ncbi:MAG: phosphatase PAP2 family protein [Haloferacaceae archaeon]
MRALGVTGVLSTAPDAVVLLFALLTQLGDPWFLFLALALTYWLAPRWVADDTRRVAALLVAFGLGAAMLTLGLKTIFALPRPPGAGTATPPPWLPSVLRGGFLWAATGDGFGFPSGHALGSTVVYGGFAALSTVADRSTRRYAAAAVVALVSLSRLVLGVHYFVDVAVGVALGLLFLWAALRVGDVDPTRAFGIAAALAVGSLAAALATAHPEQVVEAAAGVGASAGGLAGWLFTDRRGATPATVPRLAVAPAAVVAGGLWVVGSAGSLSPPAVAAVDFASVFLVVALPALVELAAGRTTTA